MTRDKGLAGGLIPQQEIVPGAFTLSDVERHNQSVVSGSGPIDITTPPDQWAYAATFPFRRPEGSGAAGKVLLVRVEVEVHGGRIGIGCVARDLRTYVDAEIDCTPEDGPTVLELPLGCPDSHECGWLVVRNTAEGNRRSHATVRSIRTFPTVASRIPDLVEAEARPIPSVGPPHATRGGSRCGTIRKFQVVLTHTSRDWDWTRCSREDLIRRYADPKRLLDLPPFEELPPPPMHLYSGGLSILELAVDGDGAHIVARRLIDSHFKIQHATLAGARLVLCFESFLAVLPAAGAPLENVDLRPGSPWRIDDNWFSGLHTAFPVHDDIWIVSSSGCDAVLWVDLRSRKVIRRWRLPSDIYGVNYELTPAMAANIHYIHNDIQLCHLNCAYPDGKGGCYVSTLAQGDIGHVDENGRYSLLTRGYVGCHGVRLAQNGRDVYFSDSCSGRLMQLEPGGGVRERWSADSRWLHDVEQADPDLYVFCLGDRNEVALVDVTNGEERGRFKFDSRGVNVQFVSVARNDG
jgi:hypothetical protein